MKVASMDETFSAPGNGRGAQQRLVSLGLQLRTAESALSCELRAFKEQIADVITGLAGVSAD
jgi:hypothetical protein